MIPKTIHQIWFQGEDNIPSHLYHYHTSWKKIHPTYKFILWDENKINILIQTINIPWIEKLYHNYDIMIQKIDLAKYIILYVYGGIYIDMDVKCLSHLDSLNTTLQNLSWNELDAIFSKSKKVHMQNIIMSFIGHDISEDIINNGIIMIRPRHPIMYEILKEAHKNNYSIYKHLSNTLYIFITTGPICVTKVLQKYKHNPHIKILHHTYFEACDIDEVHRNCKPPNYAIGLHVYENSWTTKNEKNITNLYFYIMQHPWLILIITFFIINIAKNKT